MHIIRSIVSIWRVLKNVQQNMLNLHQHVIYLNDGLKKGSEEQLAEKIFIRPEYLFLLSKKSLPVNLKNIEE